MGGRVCVGVCVGGGWGEGEGRARVCGVCVWGRAHDVCGVAARTSQGAARRNPSAGRRASSSQGAHTGAGQCELEEGMHV